MTNNNQNQSVYIQSIEAASIYTHITRGTKIDPSYVGMIPYSIELIKLREIGLNHLPTNKANPSKLLSDDIINVKFNQKVKSGSELIGIYESKIDELTVHSDLTEQEESYQLYLEDSIEAIRQELHEDKWNQLSNDELRHELYLNGFMIDDVQYVVYKRSSSKSRTGQCLFIRQALYQQMIDWSRMYLPFKEGQEVDMASLLAYESLVGSSIEGTVKINSKHILLVNDVDSNFNQKANVVKAGKDEFLESITKDDAEIVNSLFDGESLLESEYFPEGKGMMLLRNHMMKSAAFNTNIQQFLEDNCPEGVIYDEWEIKPLYGEPMLAKDIHMITTPSSIKSLKFADVIGSEEDMWEYWKDLVDKEGSIFGVCKTESKSNRGYDSGKVLQQTSYQMLNSMPLSGDDITTLSQFEMDYIDGLKNNDDKFIDHIAKGVNEVNSNQMFIELYDVNKEVVNTKVFRDFRKAEINRHVTHVKKGKLRLNADYCVMLGNPVEMLKYSIGQFDVNSSELSLEGNQIHTKLFGYDKEVVGFRNPHTSPSNVLVAKNVANKDIDTYFNLSKNIVVVNAIDFPIQDILSGADYDSDTVMLVDSERLLNVAMDCSKYPVCINQVDSEKKTYTLSKSDMVIIDNQLSLSQKYIGRVVNLGQELMSLYWDGLANGKSINDVADLMNKVDVMTVLSGIAIDLAKKMYNLDIGKEIKHVEKVTELKKKKPTFFKFISQSKTIKSRVDLYDCPMDHLGKIMTGLPDAKRRTNIDLIDLLIKKNAQKGNKTQQKKIIDYVEKMNNKISEIHLSGENKEEKFEALDDTVKYYEYFVGKMKVNENTMFSILNSMIKKNRSNVTVKLMNILFITQKETFLEAFKNDGEENVNLIFNEIA